MRLHILSISELAKAGGVGVVTALLLTGVMVPAMKFGLSPMPKPLGLAFAETVLARAAASGRPFVPYRVCGVLVDRLREPIPGQPDFHQSAGSRRLAVDRRLADILSRRWMGRPRTHG
jgi:hypothetical protein